MKRIGVISDTHNTFDDTLRDFLKDVDEIWHAGDFGSIELADQIAAFKPLKGVYGNIDGGEVRRLFSETLEWQCEEATILMTHIGGYPGKYDPRIKKRLIQNPPNLFISGHSHILRVLYDKQLSCLHINPGAAGIQGWQTVRTLVRFTIDGKDFRDLEVIELS
jgi:putative phosphoesterase